MEPTHLLQSRNLTLKQRLWLKYYIETGNATEAARQAGYNCQNEENYRYIGYQNYTKLHIPELLEEMGLTKVVLLKVLATGITKPVKYLTKLVTHGKDTQSIEHIEVPDYETRHKYLALALKMQGML
ncbi:terminase small subunit [Candidatus Daviesbacteria bacterium]|nr:terminase small subunit [Candidatus Daviesbacteria bacterium]